jgi:hypothetical protein
MRRQKPHRPNKTPKDGFMVSLAKIQNYTPSTTQTIASKPTTQTTKSNPTSQTTKSNPTSQTTKSNPTSQTTKSNPTSQTTKSIPCPIYFNPHYMAYAVKLWPIDLGLGWKTFYESLCFIDSNKKRSIEDPVWHYYYGDFGDFYCGYSSP